MSVDHTAITMVGYSVEELGCVTNNHFVPADSLSVFSPKRIPKEPCTSRKRCYIREYQKGERK